MAKTKTTSELWIELLQQAREYTNEFNKTVDRLSSNIDRQQLLEDLNKIENPLKDAILKWTYSAAADDEANSRERFDR